MSKRDIKAKRWAYRSAKRQMAIELPVMVDGFPAEQALNFLTQVRMLGDGHWQYREWVMLRNFSLKRRRQGFAGLEWRESNEQQLLIECGRRPGKRTIFKSRSVGWTGYDIGGGYGHG